MKRLVPVALFSLLCSGCALIFNDDAEQMTFRTGTPGATVFVNGVEAGKTPLTVKLDKLHVPTIMIVEPGKQPTQVRVRRRFSTLSYFDVAGEIPFAIDMFNPGCIYTFSQNEVFVSPLDLNAKERVRTDEGRVELVPYASISPDSVKRGIPAPVVLQKLVYGAKIPSEQEMGWMRNETKR